MRRAFAMTLATLALLAVGTCPTSAGPLDQRIVAVATSYLPGEVTLVQGEPLEFTNLDRPPHDVVALQNGPDGKPAFATEIIGTGETVLIEGLEKVPAGVYDFTCTLHPSMLGTLFLEEAGG